MAAKKQKSGSTKKVLKKGGGKKKSVAAANGNTEGEENAKAATAAIGHNTRIPKASEMTGYFSRLDALMTAKNEANAKYMSDIKAVYEEAANKFGSSRKLMRRLYAKKKAEDAFAEEMAELEVKERDDMDRLMLGALRAFGPNEDENLESTPFGDWLAATIKRDEKDFDEVTKPAAEVVKAAEKTPAAAALEKIEADERAIQKEQTTH